MSSIFQEITNAELAAKEECSTVEKSLQEMKNSAVQKAKDILLGLKKDADLSFDNKLAILEKDLSFKEEEISKDIERDVSSFLSKKDEYVKKGVDFLFPRLVSQS